jgi:protein SCO1/2
VLAGLAVVAALALLSHRPPPPEVLATLPDFRLVAHDGRPFTRDTQLGQPFVADFIFTTCGGVCPAMTARMAQLQHRLPAGMGIASFTVDPAQDTPAVLAGYARDFKAGPAWRFVTGDRDALYRLATEGFKLAAMEVPADQRQAGGDGPFLHSAKFVLVDGQSRVRGYYDSDDREALDRLVSDAMQIASGR